MAYQSFDATVQSFMATLQQQSPRADSIGFFPTTTQVSVSSSEQYGNSPPLGYRQVAGILDNHGEERFIEIPVFTGDWMEHRFVTEEFTELQKLALAHGFIYGEAEVYVQHRQKFLPIHTWTSFKCCLLFQFGDDEDPVARR